MSKQLQRDDAQAEAKQLSELVTPVPQLQPAQLCECELRDRQWNFQGKCLTCGRKYRRS